MEERKKEIEEMKKRLWNWGNSMEQFNWKEEELQKMQVFHEMQKKVWEENATEKSQEELKQMEKEYRKEVGRLRIEMVEILREKGRIDEMIRRLDMDEQTFLQLRFEKGNGFDYISMKMYLSRATLFRMQERVLEKMIGMKTDRD